MLYRHRAIKKGSLHINEGNAFIFISRRHPVLRELNYEGTSSQHHHLLLLNISPL
jgi:hypothetical protein